eukprot:gene30700-37096_t
MCYFLGGVGSSHHGPKSHAAVKEYDLPIINKDIKKHVEELLSTPPKPEYPKYIPRKAWIAVRNSSDERAAHMLGPNGFVARNNLWTFHFEGNEEKDAFMHTVYHNTSLLWAYNILNPVIGTAKAELWRLAVLYYEGGLYMDDDATFNMPLDDIVKPQYKFMVGTEGYNWTDNCYTEDYSLSNSSLSRRFGVANDALFFNNKYFFNWALFIMPGHPILLRIMEHVVRLIKFEYVGQSKIKLSPSEHRGKLLMCASTYPITLGMREVILEAHGDRSILDSYGLYIGEEMFREFGANMKAWNNDHNPNRWVKQMNKKKLPYLRHYAPPDVTYYEGLAVQGQHSREIYLVRQQRRHAFPDFNTFLKMGFGIDKVKMVDRDIIAALPLGDPLPSIP